MRLTLTIKGNPQPWQRAEKRGKRHFTPPKMKAYQRTIAQIARIAMRREGLREPLDAPIVLRATAIIAPPASYSKKRKLALIGAPVAVAPDGDNYLKNVKDALEGVVYVNDSRVFDGRIVKLYGVEPRLEIEIVSVASAEAAA